MSQAEQSSIVLSVEQWLELVQRGANIPVTIPLMGTSMLPVIRYKVDPTTIVPLNREPVEGDIVLFRRFGDGAWVVHRVYRVMGDQVQTWGDNSPRPDHPVSREDVPGLVVSICRNGKTIRLDTEEQRRWGVKWMHSTVRRRLWFTWSTLRWLPGKLIRKVWPNFHKNKGN